MHAMAKYNNTIISPFIMYILVLPNSPPSLEIEVFSLEKLSL
jgi:hypothetical protein